MTGFGRAIAETKDKKITVEIKSLNSKQMDLTVRIPQLLHAAEPQLRIMASHSLQRGKSDLVVTCDISKQDAPSTFNTEAIKAYKEQLQKLSAELGIPTPTEWYNTLLRLPDAIKSETSVEANDDDFQALYAATQMAIDELVSHRREEGKKLEDFFTIRIDRIAALLQEIPKYEEERLVRIRARIEDNLSKLTSAEYDQGRYEQEMIYYIEKLDINEEKQRLTQHLKYFKETMAQPEGGQGKKLGFISQEMGREINTLGSKSNHAEMQKIVVMMKDELEQIKEQVLNVM